jgi:hypothetical protein
MKKILFLSVLISLVVGSCKKDEKCEIKVSKIAGSYKIVAIKYKLTSSSPEVDGMFFLDACTRDDLDVLNENGSYNHQDAGTACTPANNYSGTWALNGTTLVIDGETSTIQSFDCSQLVLVITDWDTSGDRATFTLQKQ